MNLQSDLNFKFSQLTNSLSTDPYFYWITFLKYKKQLILIPIFISILGLLLSKSIQPTYQSVASLILDNKQNNIINIEQVYSETQNNLNNSNFINTQKEIIKSNVILKRLYEKNEFLTDSKKLLSTYDSTLFNKILSIFKKNNLLDDKKKDELIKNQLIKNLIVSNSRDTNILVLKFNSKSKEFSKFVLENIIRAYLEYDIDQKISVTSYANNKIQERLDELKTNLENSEKILQQYKEQNKLIDLGSIKDLKTEEIKSLSSRILKAEKELQELQNNLQQISLSNNDFEELTSLKVIREVKEVEQILSNLDANNNTINSLKLVYTENHPKLDKALKTEENLKTKLKEIIDQNISTKAYEIANLESFIDLSQSELDNAREELQNLEIQDLEMQKYTREVDLNKRIYESFLERLKETTEAKELQTPNAKILDDPNLPIKPISPQVDKITFLCFVISISILYSLVTYYETFRNAVSDPAVLEKNGFEILNIVPKTTAKKGYHLPMNFLEKNNDKFSESIIYLKTILLSKYKDSKVFMITSPVSGEGKTTISLNLALSLSTQFKVLFLETDFRRPSLMKSLNLENRKGLIELFNDEAEFSKIKFNIYSTKLDIVAAGNPSNFNKIIDQIKLKKFINLLKTHYDFIIIDTAPVLPVADTLSISEITDTTIFVVRYEYTKVGGLINAKRKIEAVSDTNITTIMNYFDTENINYYNYSNYGSYYKNYYNYSST